MRASTLSDLLIDGEAPCRQAAVQGSLDALKQPSTTRTACCEGSHSLCLISYLSTERRHAARQLSNKAFIRPRQLNTNYSVVVQRSLDPFQTLKHQQQRSVTVQASLGPLTNTQHSTYTRAAPLISPVVPRRWRRLGSGRAIHVWHTREACVFDGGKLNGRPRSSIHAAVGVVIGIQAGQGGGCSSRRGCHGRWIIHAWAAWCDLCECVSACVHVNGGGCSRRGCHGRWIIHVWAAWCDLRVSACVHMTGGGCSSRCGCHGGHVVHVWEASCDLCKRGCARMRWCACKPSYHTSQAPGGAKKNARVVKHCVSTQLTVPETTLACTCGSF